MARNKNFVLVVLASPFDSIAHRAFCLLAPDSSLPYPAGISRAEPLASLWRRLSLCRVRSPADTSCRSSSKRRDESGRLQTRGVRATLSRRRSERHTGHRIASACQPRRNRYTSPSLYFTFVPWFDPVASAPQIVSPSGWAPLRRPLFRNRWIASLVSNLGSWMQDTAGAWA